VPRLTSAVTSNTFLSTFDIDTTTTSCSVSNNIFGAAVTFTGAVINSAFNSGSFAGKLGFASTVDDSVISGNIVEHAGTSAAFGTGNVTDTVISDNVFVAESSNVDVAIGSFTRSSISNCKFTIESTTDITITSLTDSSISGNYISCDDFIVLGTLANSIINGNTFDSDVNFVASANSSVTFNSITGTFSFSSTLDDSVISGNIVEHAGTASPFVIGNITDTIISDNVFVATSSTAPITIGTITRSSISNCKFTTKSTTDITMGDITSSLISGNNFIGDDWDIASATDSAIDSNHFATDLGFAAGVTRCSINGNKTTSGVVIFASSLSNSSFTNNFIQFQKNADGYNYSFRCEGQCDTSRISGNYTLGAVWFPVTDSAALADVNISNNDIDELLVIGDTSSASGVVVSDNIIGAISFKNDVSNASISNNKGSTFTIDGAVTSTNISGNIFSGIVSVNQEDAGSSIDGLIVSSNLMNAFVIRCNAIADISGTVIIGNTCSGGFSYEALTGPTNLLVPDDTGILFGFNNVGKYHFVTLENGQVYWGGSANNNLNL